MGNSLSVTIMLFFYFKSISIGGRLPRNKRQNRECLPAVKSLLNSSGGGLLLRAHAGQVDTWDQTLVTKVPGRASTWQTKYPHFLQSHIFCKVTFALFKIFDVANMRQCHWIRDKWFVLLDILSSTKRFVQPSRLLMKYCHCLFYFLFLFCLSEKYFWYISEDNSIYSSSMTIKFRYGNRQMFLSTLSRNWIELTCGYEGYWTDIFSKLTTPLQSSWWCRDMASLAT